MFNKYYKIGANSGECLINITKMNRKQRNNLKSIIGKSLNKYLVQDFIGHGGFGSVYKVCEEIKKDETTSKYDLFIKWF